MEKDNQAKIEKDKRHVDNLLHALGLYWHGIYWYLGIPRPNKKKLQKTSSRKVVYKR